MAYVIIFKTSESLIELEDWMENNLQGHWSMSIEGLSDDRAVKTLRIAFETLEEKERFKAAYQRK
jgi:hypothetical protein